MTRFIETLTLVAIGVAIGRVSKKNKKSMVTVKIKDLDAYKKTINDLKGRVDEALEEIKNIEHQDYLRERWKSFKPGNSEFHPN